MEIILAKPARNGSKPTKPLRRSARAADGTNLTVRVIDADSPSFAQDFTAAFNANIRRARTANKKVRNGG